MHSYYLMLNPISSIVSLLMTYTHTHYTHILKIVTNFENLIIHILFNIEHRIESKIFVSPLVETNNFTIRASSYKIRIN